MNQTHSAIPEGYHSVTPYLMVEDAKKAIEYYQTVFNAVERMRFPSPDGQKVMHAELEIGDSVIMLADALCPQMGSSAPGPTRNTPVSLHLYVANVDKTFDLAVAKGATVVKPVQDQFYGDRSGCVQDPFGHVWSIATHKEDLTVEEVQQRAMATMAH